jgi:hypothetical protein
VRNRSYIVLIAVLIVIGIVYWGGAITVGGAPIFYHLDQKLGTTCFMRSHQRLMSVFRRGPREKKPDPFTKPYVDFDKVLEQTSK